MVCFQPMQPLEEKHCIEIVISHKAHDEIRRCLDQYVVVDKQTVSRPRRHREMVEVSGN